jgi:hypothetical protein
MTTTTNIIKNEHRSLTTPVLINSFFMKVIVWWMFLTDTGGILPHDDPASSSLIVIQMRITVAHHVAVSFPIQKKHVDKEHQVVLLQPSLALSLTIEMFAFDYFHMKTLPVATILPSSKYIE